MGLGEELEKVYNFPLSVGVYFSLLVGAPDTMITVSTINGNRSYEHVSHKSKSTRNIWKKKNSSWRGGSLQLARFEIKSLAYLR